MYSITGGALRNDSILVLLSFKTVPSNNHITSKNIRWNKIIDERNYSQITFPYSMFIPIHLLSIPQVAAFPVSFVLNIMWLCVKIFLNGPMEIKLLSNKCCLNEIQSMESARSKNKYMYINSFATLFLNVILSQLDGHK